MRLSDQQFLNLLEQEQPKLLRIARVLTGQEADAWDVVQDASLTAYDRLGDLRGGPPSFAPWIRRILVNRCRSLLRARSRMVLLESVAAGDPSPEPGPEERALGAEIWDEVTALEEHHRQVLVLRFLVDMSVDELADLLDVPSGTVKSRLHRALHLLRRRLESRGERSVTLS